MGKKDVYNVPPIRGSKVVARTNAVVPSLKKVKTLKPKEWKFVQELVAGDGHVTMKEAAIRAGYKRAVHRLWLGN